MLRILKVVAGLAAVVGAILVGLQLSAAADVSAEQLLLKSSDLPPGSQVQIRGPLIPGSCGNGFIDKDCKDLVQGYITGERVDFMVPLGKVEGASGDQSMAQAYISHLVYRFSNEQTAANEFQRLAALADSQPNVTIKSQSVGSSARPSIVFEVTDSEIPIAAHRWFFMWRGQFLIVYSSPGPLQSSALYATQSNDAQLTQKGWEDYNRAVDTLFASVTSRLQSR